MARSRGGHESSLRCDNVADIGGDMPSKKKKSKFKIATEARRRARLGIGLPPPERAIVEKHLKKPKHKQMLKDLLGEE
jgi:hypothetical protein